jgi:BirA family transcriptional regulator, biotin operon repressor / biotin---[acetyl-CoA-carboxylase] ligase
MIIRLTEAGFSGRVQAVVQKASHVTQVHYKDATGSTNDDALLLARAGAPHGTLVVADCQRSGRGREGRAWHSPPGVGLWFSWILRPNLPLDRAFWLSAAAGVAVAETAARTAGVLATLRWPNDVLVRGRKLAGLLAEGKGEKDRIEFVILGVGLNVNQLEADFAAEIAAQATSLRMAGGHELDRSLVLATFIEAFEFLYQNVERDQGRTIRREWLSRATVIGRPVSVTLPVGVLEGRAVDLLEDGALVVEDAGGTKREIRAGDVRLLRELE